MNLLYNFKFLVRNKKRNILLLVQLTFSFIIIFTLLVALLNTFKGFNSTKNLNKKNILIGTINFNGKDFTSKRELIKHNLKNNKFISKFALCSEDAPYSKYRVLNVAEYDNRVRNVDIITTSSDYFDILDLNFISGFKFNNNNLNDIVITKSLSDYWFKNESPIKKQISLFSGKNKRSFRIVGVIEDYKHYSDYNVLSYGIFKPIKNNDYINEIIIKVHPNIHNYAFESNLKDIIFNIDKNWRFKILDLEERSKIRNNNITIPLLIFFLIVVFLIINVILGISGLLSMNIRKRFKEIGIRRAIGSTRNNIYWLITLDITIISTIGIIIGIIIINILPITQIFSSSEQTNIKSFFFSILLLYIIGLLASIIPSLKATNVNPQNVLR